MTNSLPPDPSPSDKTPLGFDDFIGILVAFSAIGGIIWWSLSRNPQAINLDRILSSDRNSTPLLVPSPQAAEVETAPTLAPSVSPSIASDEVPQRRAQVPVVVVPNGSVAASPTPKTGTPVTFIDVPPDYWARPYIHALAASGVVSGYAGDYFRPNQTITRAEFAALLQDAFDNQSVDGTTKYKDIETNFWGIPAINSATTTGFLQGYPGDVFRPTQEIPRVQVLVAIASGLKLPASATQSVLQSYGDANEIPNYAKDKVAAATNAGLIANYPDRNILAPNRNATRAEVAAIVYQAMVQQGKLQPIDSPYVGNTK
ncbi:S-layer homology domain-containing protein [Chlorogloea sp. CCALA 695]|uniref:S-layer homology domain-containing protein n=1 Tax=Chlorogloea sp. CCALA 695 TaxID=2107693 RepID=UPI000D07A4F4|nr:S-layer homology domain-containing protein [Chlorogloea sp. CCALA 695]PSB32526.1 S-layer protein [Chlorogloea sp. CCALA 695]